MKLRRPPATSERPSAGLPFDDAGGHGAEYVDSPVSRDTDEEVQEDRTAWSRARHWTPERSSN